MYSTKKSLFPLLVFLFIFLYFLTPSFSADLYLTDFSGQTGPAPAPAPYATTYLYLHNSPKDISKFSIRIYFDADILSAWSQSINNGVFKDWDYTLISSVSGAQSYIKIEGWTLGPPITAGSSGLIAELAFKVNQNADSSVWLSDLQNDIQSFTIENASFIYISSLDNYPPIADAGPDQTVFESVTLDASGSTDQDNQITAWEWQLVHRSNSSYNRNVSGKIVSLDNLLSGFYDVTLTVTDETGLKDTNTSLIAVSKKPMLLELKEGWSMVSFIGDKSINISEFISGHETSVVSIWYYQAGNWHVYDPGYIEFSDLTKLLPGTGFWIKCSSDTIIEY